MKFSKPMSTGGAQRQRGLAPDNSYRVGAREARDICGSQPTERGVGMRFDAVLSVRVPNNVPALVEAAASEELQRPATFIRQAIFEALKRRGLMVRERPTEP